MNILNLAGPLKRQTKLVYPIGLLHGVMKMDLNKV